MQKIELLTDLGKFSSLSLTMVGPMSNLTNLVKVFLILLMLLAFLFLVLIVVGKRYFITLSGAGSRFSTYFTRRLPSFWISLFQVAWCKSVCYSRDQGYLYSRLWSLPSRVIKCFLPIPRRRGGVWFSTQWRQWCPTFSVWPRVVNLQRPVTKGICLKFFD